MTALVMLGGNFLNAQTRIKDVAYVQGARDNDLIGYGLVVGLDGQGDSDPDLTKQTVANLVRRFGININMDDIKAKNAAVVMITARIPAFARSGSKLDITVSSLADAKTLQGGTLLQTPLMGADNQIYAVAQGPVSVGGFFAGTSGGGGASVQKNHPTAGRIPGGAIIEKEIPTDLFENGLLEITLRENDFTSAVRMANAINQELGSLSYAQDAGTVKVFLPTESQAPEKRTEFIARVENIKFRTDVPARIVMNEKTGTIVANSNIRIHRVAVAHGNLTVNIASTENVSQPNPFTNVYVNEQGSAINVPVGIVPPPGFLLSQNPESHDPADFPSRTAGAQTVVTQSTTTDVKEEKSPVFVFEELPTIEEVAAALNALGVTPRDMMAIFQTMKQAGALQAELVLQ